MGLIAVLLRSLGFMLLEVASLGFTLLEAGLLELVVVLVRSFGFLLLVISVILPVLVAAADTVIELSPVPPLLVDMVELPAGA